MKTLRDEFHLRSPEEFNVEGEFITFGYDRVGNEQQKLMYFVLNELTAFKIAHFLSEDLETGDTAEFTQGVREWEKLKNAAKTQQIFLVPGPRHQSFLDYMRLHWNDVSRHQKNRRH
jgi:hypothetical protein